MSKSHAKRSARHTPPPRRTTQPLWGIALAVIVIVVGVAVFISRQNTNAPAASSVDARNSVTNGAAGTPSEISVKEAAAKRDAGAFILDVREPDEWADFHVPGSTLIPLGQLQNRLNEVPRDKEIVVVCRSGNRSKSGRDILTDAGFTRVTSMAGGLRDWQAQGFPTVNGQ